MPGENNIEKVISDHGSSVDADEPSIQALSAQVAAFEIQL